MTHAADGVLLQLLTQIWNICKVASTAGARPCTRVMQVRLRLNCASQPAGMHPSFQRTCTFSVKTLCQRTSFGGILMPLIGAENDSGRWSLGDVCCRCTASRRAPLPATVGLHAKHRHKPDALVRTRHQFA